MGGKKNLKKKINVTMPFLPPIDEFNESLRKIWSSRVFTNNGPFCKKFEKKLCNYTKIRNISLVNNATTGLIIGLKYFQLKGEVITTPFSFPATAHSIEWNNLTPIFADVEQQTGNLCPESVERLITKKTSAILAVHNFGLPFQVENLSKLAATYNLPLVYDAAPAFGVKYKGESIFSLGDLSVVSFHATKILTTFEGGAIFLKTGIEKNKVDLLKNFSIKDTEEVLGSGINGKMNEISAAFGLTQFPYLSKIISKRKKVYDLYSVSFRSNVGLRLIDIPENTEYNYAYCPIYISDGFEAREKLYNKLKSNNIHCRKYWYPLLSKISIYSKNVHTSIKKAIDMSEKILCLPIYPDLELEDQEKIIDIIKSSV